MWKRPKPLNLHAELLTIICAGSSATFLSVNGISGGKLHTPASRQNGYGRCFHVPYLSLLTHVFGWTQYPPPRGEGGGALGLESELAILIIGAIIKLAHRTIREFFLTTIQTSVATSVHNLHSTIQQSSRLFGGPGTYCQHSNRRRPA